MTRGETLFDETVTECECRYGDEEGGEQTEHHVDNSPDVQGVHTAHERLAQRDELCQVRWVLRIYAQYPIHNAQC